MEIKKKSISIVDSSTGEVIKKLKEGDRIEIFPPKCEEEKKLDKRKEIKKRGRGRFLSDEVIDRLVFYDFKGQKWGFSFIFNEEMREILPELSSPAVKVLMLFISWLHMDGYCYPGNRKKMVTQEQIAKAAGMQRKYVSAALEELIEKEIVCALRDSYSWRYLMNPYISGKGKGYDREQAEYFEEYAKKRGKELPE